MFVRTFTTIFGYFFGDGSAHKGDKDRRKCSIEIWLRDLEGLRNGVSQADFVVNMAFQRSRSILLKKHCNTFKLSEIFWLRILYLRNICFKLLLNAKKAICKFCLTKTIRRGIPMHFNFRMFHFGKKKNDASMHCKANQLPNIQVTVLWVLAKIICEVYPQKLQDFLSILI